MSDSFKNKNPIKAPTGWLKPPNKLAYRKLLIRECVATYNGSAIVKPSEMLCRAIAKNKAKPIDGDTCEVTNVMSPSLWSKMWLNRN